MKLHLGKKRESSGMIATADRIAGKDDTSYPALHMDGHDPKDLDKIPEKGKATIHYKVTSRGHHEVDGKKHGHLSMDVHHIEVEKKKPKPVGNQDARKAVQDHFDKMDSDGDYDND